MRKKNIKLKLRIIEMFETQADFAAEVDEDETVVSRVICGRRELKPERKVGWAKTLKCTVSDIFS